MKKIFTFLLAAGAFATSFAQTGHQNNDKKSNGYVTNTEYKEIDSHGDNIYTFSVKEKDMQIAKINNDYDFKIKSIWSNHRISRAQKKIMIQKVQNEKYQKIEAVNAKFNSKFNAAFNDHVKQYDKHKH